MAYNIHKIHEKLFDHLTEKENLVLYTYMYGKVCGDNKSNFSFLPLYTILEKKTFCATIRIKAAHVLWENDTIKFGVLNFFIALVKSGEINKNEIWGHIMPSLFDNPFEPKFFDHFLTNISNNNEELLSNIKQLLNPSIAKGSLNFSQIQSYICSKNIEDEQVLDFYFDILKSKKRFLFKENSSVIAHMLLNEFKTENKLSKFYNLFPLLENLLSPTIPDIFPQINEHQLIIHFDSKKTEALISNENIRHEDLEKAFSEYFNYLEYTESEKYSKIKMRNYMTNNSNKIHEVVVYSKEIITEEQMKKTIMDFVNFIKHNPKTSYEIADFKIFHNKKLLEKTIGKEKISSKMKI